LLITRLPRHLLANTFGAALRDGGSLVTSAVFRFNGSRVQRYTWRQPVLYERPIKRDAKLAAASPIEPVK